MAFPSGLRAFDVWMRILELARVTRNAPTQDFGHHRSGVAGAIDPKISELIRREALGM